MMTTAAICILGVSLMFTSLAGILLGRRVDLLEDEIREIKKNLDNANNKD